MSSYAAPLRVLLTTGNYPPDIGGPATQTKMLADEFARQGCEVCVLTFEKAERDLSGNVRYVRVNRSRGMLGKFYRYFQVILQTRQHFREFEPDFLITQTSAGPLPLAAGIVAKLRGTRSWIKIANDPMLDLANTFMMSQPAGALGHVRRWLSKHHRFYAARLTFALYERVWTTTPVFAERMISQYFIPRERLKISPNLFRMPKLLDRDACGGAGKSSTVLRLLYVGRLQPIKGVDVLLSALAELPDINWKLRIIGEGDATYTSFLTGIVAQQGLTQRVDWLGPVLQEDLAAFYRTSDLVIVPSRNEAFGNVIVEAMSHATPVITTSVGGTPYISQNGKAARLIPPEDPISLADAIRSLYSEPDECARLSCEGLRRAQDFSLESGVHDWIVTFRSIDR